MSSLEHSYSDPLDTLSEVVLLLLVVVVVVVVVFILFYSILFYFLFFFFFLRKCTKFSKVRSRGAVPLKSIHVIRLMHIITIIYLSTCGISRQKKIYLKQACSPKVNLYSFWWIKSICTFNAASFHWTQFAQNSVSGTCELICAV